MALVNIQLQLLQIDLVGETLEEACERIIKRRKEELPTMEGLSSSDMIVADIDGYYVADNTLFKVQNLEIEEFGGYAKVEEDEEDPSILNFSAVCDDEEDSIESLITYALYGSGDEEGED
jgi:hypothetical protein